METGIGVTMRNFSPRTPISTSHIEGVWKTTEAAVSAFLAKLETQTRFSYYERFNWWELCSTEPFPPDIPREPRDHFYGHMGLLRIWDDDELGEFHNPGQWPQPDAPYSSAKRAEFAARWLPFFRRNCWLSGCRIECSREERREWIQGLTPQEIEEWQLKV